MICFMARIVQRGSSGQCLMQACNKQSPLCQEGLSNPITPKADIYLASAGVKTVHEHLTWSPFSPVLPVSPGSPRGPYCKGGTKSEQGVMTMKRNARPRTWEGCPTEEIIGRHTHQYPVCKSLWKNKTTPPCRISECLMGPEQCCVCLE